MFWSLLQNAGGRAITFIITLVLARLLSPEEFGLIGMLTIFIQVSQTIIYAGFNQALIRKRDADEGDYSSVFYINLIVSIVVYCVVYFMAPSISRFYDQPILVDLVRGLSLIFVVNAFSYVQESRLSKNMQFRKLTMINLPSVVLGGIVSVWMAVGGYGVWSIIGLQLTTRTAYAIQIWAVSKWSPTLSFDKKKSLDLFSFGGKLMISGIIDSIYKNIYLVIIGKYFPLSSVGFYQNANNLVQYPTSTLSMAFGKVAFPALASIQDDSEKMKSFYRRINQQVLFWICPIFVLAGVMAEPLFRFAFTEKWLPAVPYFQLLCVTGALFPRYIFNRNVLNVDGRSDLILRLTVFEKIFTTIGIIVAIPYGIWALLTIQVLSALFVYFIYSYFSGQVIDYSLIDQIRDTFPIILLSTAVGTAIFGLDIIIFKYSDFMRILICFIAGGILYISGAKFLRFAPYADLTYIVRDRIVRPWNRKENLD